LSVPVTAGGELDPNLDPDAVMAATLAPGVRKVPSPLELAIISTLWGTKPVPPGSSAGGFVTVADPAQPSLHASPSSQDRGTPVLDRAIAALGSAPQAGDSPASLGTAAGSGVVVKLLKRHHATARASHSGASAGRASTRHGLTMVHKAGRIPAQQTPHAGLALRLSRRSPRGDVGVHAPH
jgi:hypothetical protein